MKLFLISQTQNDDFDTFDSAVVAAPDKKTARRMNPRTGKLVADWAMASSAWCSGPEHVSVQLIGTAAAGVKKDVICASFRAG